MDKEVLVDMIDSVICNLNSIDDYQDGFSLKNECGLLEDIKEYIKGKELNK